MRHRLVFVITFVFVTIVKGRVYYLDNSNEHHYGDTNYPVPNEQSSRDLDLSFSAGESGENDNTIRPVKKVYTLVSPEKQYVELNKQVDYPNTYYKLFEVPAKRNGLDDIIVLPEKNRKPVKINGNNKGEVILELRVIANHDTL